MTTSPSAVVTTVRGCATTLLGRARVAPRVTALRPARAPRAGDRAHSPSRLGRAVFARIALAATVALGSGACELFASGPAATDRGGGNGGNRGDSGATRAPGPQATPTPDATTTPVIPSLLGDDRHLTLLLLGSDARPTNPGIRTDTIMVVSLHARTRDAFALSIPRDIARFPIPGGRIYTQKINTLYEWYLEREGDRDVAAAATKDAIGELLGIEIDYWAYTGFAGVRQMVDALGGVDVHLQEAVRDPKYQVSATERGVYFPKGRNHLDGDEALQFARSRGGDNDFARADRQQLLVMSAIAELRDVDASELPALVDVATRKFRTDLPLTAAPELLELAAKADLRNAKRIVLAPPRFGREVIASGLYQLRLDLDAVEELVEDWFE